MHTNQNLVHGALFILGSELVLASVGATVKAASEGLPFEMLVFFRNIFGLLALAPLLLRKEFSGIKTEIIHLHLLRASVGVCGMYCLFYAIANINLADAMLLKLTAPIFIPWVAWLWLKEPVPYIAVIAVLIGFFGVFLILKPGGEWNTVVLVAVAGSLLVAVTKVTIRRLSITEPAVRIVFYFAVFASCISAVPLLWGWRTPTATQWLLLVMIGTLATTGQLLMTRGFALAPAGQVAIFGYSSVLFAAMYGWFLWGEIWDVMSIAGAALICTAGLLILKKRSSPAIISPE